MILLAKILSIALGLIVISKTFLDFKKEKESLIMFIFWLITWGTVITLSVFPTLIESFNQFVGSQGNGVNTFIGAAFVFLLFITYRVYTKANRIEQQLHQMVMKMGLKEIEEE
jgi:hypothetical protein